MSALGKLRVTSSESSYLTPASFNNPLNTASTISPNIMFIINVVGKGSANSGLFLSYHSWQAGLPMLDIRNLKAPLGLLLPNCLLTASITSLPTCEIVLSEKLVFPLTASSIN